MMVYLLVKAHVDISGKRRDFIIGKLSSAVIRNNQHEYAANRVKYDDYCIKIEEAL